MKRFLFSIWTYLTSAARISPSKKRESGILDAFADDDDLIHPSRYRRIGNLTVFVFAFFFLFVQFVDAAFAEGESALPSVTMPDFPEGQSISLKKALRKAKSKNRSIQMLAYDLRQADIKLKSAWAGLLPSLYGNVNYTMNDYAERQNVGGVSIETKPKHQASLGLTASLPILQATSWMGIHAARAERAVNKLSIEQAEQTLLYAVLQSYLQTATMITLIEIYRTQAMALEKHWQTAKARFRSGVGSLLDVKRAESDWVSVKENEIKAIFAALEARDAFGVLLGFDDGRMPIPKAMPESLIERFDDAIRRKEKGPSRRYDLRISKQAIEQYERALKTQYLQFAPSLMANAQFNYNLTPPDTTQAFDKSRWAIGLTLNLPFFDYTFYPSIQSAKTKLSAAKLEREQIEIEANLEIREANRALRKTESLFQAARLRKRLAKETLQLALSGYANGTTQALSVIDARRSYQTAAVDEQTKRLEEELSKLNVLEALGEDVMMLVR